MKRSLYSGAAFGQYGEGYVRLSCSQHGVIKESYETLEGIWKNMQVSEARGIVLYNRKFRETNQAGQNLYREVREADVFVKHAGKITVESHVTTLVATVCC